MRYRDCVLCTLLLLFDGAAGQGGGAEDFLDQTLEMMKDDKNSPLNSQEANDCLGRNWDRKKRLVKESFPIELPSGHEHPLYTDEFVRLAICNEKDFAFYMKVRKGGGAALCGVLLSCVAR